jgi:hypothetical protein
VNCPHLVLARIIWSDDHSGKLLTKPVHCLARNCGIHGSLLVRQPDPSGRLGDHPSGARAFGIVAQVPLIAQSAERTLGG